MAVNSIQIEHKLFTVSEYDQMIAAGVLGEDDRLELIEGDIIKMSPIGSLHVFIVNRLNNLLVPLVRGRAIVSVQNPIRLKNSEPQPDLALLLPDAGRRPHILPGADDVLLLIEVADTTAAYDRSVKVPLYGREDVREIWLVDLQDGSIGVYRGPSTSGYRQHETYGPGDVLMPQALPDVRLNVDDIISLPPTDG